MGYKDIYEWMNHLEKNDELKRITAEVDWNREAGAIARKVQSSGGPAILFDNIKDYKETRCKKLYMCDLASTRRIALMLGLSKDALLKDIIALTKERFKERLKPILVSSGPVKENILLGEEVNLYEFPVPFLHHLDGGRFFTTACALVTRDPDTGWVNVGTYRGMMVGENRISMGGLVSSNHFGQHHLKYKQRKEPTPLAVAFAWEPAMNFVATAAIRAGIDEYDIMGAIRGEPVELVRCETVDLLVPSRAQIVIEGHISYPEVYEKEGPFAEYTGYYGGESALRPVFQVECITHRSDPIYTSAMEGWGPGHPNETGTMMQISGSAVMWDILESAGVPGIMDVYLLPASRLTTLAVAIRKMYLGHAKQVAMAVWGAGIQHAFNKYVIVVDDDIDIYDLEAIEWAIAYRVNPGENDIQIVYGTHGAPLDPSTRLKDRQYGRLGTGKWNRMLIDATINWEYDPIEQYGGKPYPPIGFKLPPEDEELVTSRWKEYGF